MSIPVSVEKFAIFLALSVTSLECLCHMWLVRDRGKDVEAKLKLVMICSIVVAAHGFNQQRYACMSCHCLKPLHIS